MALATLETALSPLEIAKIAKIAISTLVMQ